MGVIEGRVEASDGQVGASEARVEASWSGWG